MQRNIIKYREITGSLEIIIIAWHRIFLLFLQIVQMISYEIRNVFCTQVLRIFRVYGYLRTEPNFVCNSGHIKYIYTPKNIGYFHFFKEISLNCIQN